MTARKYQAHPVEVEAIRWDGTVEGATEIIDWVLAAGGTASYHDEERIMFTPYRPDDINERIAPAHISLRATPTTVPVHAGDWIAGRGPDGWAVYSDLLFRTQFAVVDRDERPHSRACGMHPHDHGTACSTNCPTCQGRP